MADSSQTLPNGSSYLFNADAQAILEASPDLNSGLQILANTYAGSKWDDPNGAAQTASQYGELLRNRFKDQSNDPVNPEQVPVRLSDVVTPDLVQPFPTTQSSIPDYAPEDVVPREDTTSDKAIRKIDAWEQANLQSIQASTDPTVVIQRTKLMNSIQTTASQLRNSQEGASAGHLEDDYYRAIEGAAGGIAKLTGADSWLQSVQERENRNYDGSFQAGLAQGVGLVGASAATFYLGGAPGWAYLAGQGAGQVRGTYDDSLKKTGDSGAATIAAGIEGVSQAGQLVGGKFLAQPVIGAISKGLIGAASEAGENAVASLATKGLEGAGLVAAGGVASKVASNVGSLQPAGKNAFQGFGQNAALGLVFGTAPEALAQGAKALTDTSGSLPPSEPPPPPSFGNESSDVSLAQTGYTPKAIDPNEPPPPGAAGATVSDFKTADGSSFAMGSDGAASTTDQSGTDSHPMDHTKFVQPEVATKLKAIQAATQSGNLDATITTDGENLLVKSKNVDSNLNIVGEPQDTTWQVVPASDYESVGSHAVSASAPRTSNGVDNVHSWNVSEPITEVNPENIQIPEARAKGESQVGAAAAVPLPEGFAQSKFAARLRGASTLPNAFKELLGTEETPTDIATYIQNSDKATAQESNSFIGERGLENATNEALTFKTSPIKNQASILNELSQRWGQAYNDALKAGDQPAADKILKIQSAISDQLVQHSVSAGQGLQGFRAIAESLNPELALAKLRGNITSRVAEEIGASEGVTPTEVQGVAERIKQNNELLKQLPKSEGENTEPLSASEQATKNRLEGENQNLEKISKKFEEAKAQAFESYNNAEGKLRTLLNYAKGATGKAQIDAFAAAEKLHNEINPEDPKDSYQPSRGLFGDQRWWVTQVLSNPLGAPIKKILGDAAIGAAHGSGLGTTDLLTGRGLQPALEGFKAFFKTLGDVVKPVLQEDLLRQNPSYLPASSTEDFLSEKGGLNKGTSSRVGIQELPQPPLPIDLLYKGFGLISSKLENFFRKTAPAFTDATFAAPWKIFMRAGRDAYGNYLAYRGGIQEGLSGDALKQYVAQELYSAPKNAELAVTQARKEQSDLKDLGINWNENQVALRALDIIQGKRGDLSNQAQLMAGKLSLTSPPTGAFGMFVTNIGKAIQKALPITYKGQNIAEAGEFVAPFMNALGNIIDMHAEHFPPTALASYLMTEGLESPFKESLSPEDLVRARKFGNLVNGTIGTALLAGAASAGFIKIHGSGPASYQKRQQMHEVDGWIPNSIEIPALGNAPRFFGAGETPAGLIVSALGHYFDKERYDPNFKGQFWKEFAAAHSHSLLDYLSSGAQASTEGVGAELTQPAFMSSLKNLVEAAWPSNQMTSDQRASLIENSLAQPLKGFVPLSGALHQVARSFDTPIETYNSMWAKLVSGIPAVQHIGTEPKLDLFGRPMSASITDRLGAVSEVVSSGANDPNMRWLGDNGYSVPDVYGLTLHGESTHKDRIAPTANEQSRARTLGADYSNVLTPSERSDYIAEVGPRVQAVVGAFRSQYGTSGYQSAIQDRLNASINQVSKQALRDIAVAKFSRSGQ